MKAFLKKTQNLLFIGNIPFQDHYEYHRIYLTNFILLITTTTLFAFTYLNFAVLNQHEMGVIDLAAGLVALYAFIDLRFSKNLKKSVFIVAVTLFVLFLTLAETQQNRSFILIWTIFFPIFVMTLLGHKKGLFASVIFYTCLFYLSYRGIGIWQNGTWDFSSWLRLVVASIVLTYILYIRELALFCAVERQQQTQSKLHELSITDSLTGLFNRRHITEKLNTLIAKQAGKATDLKLAVIDIDNFKHINDQYGHNYGDTVLKSVTQSIQKHLNDNHILARWGGEEFLLVIQHQSTEQARQLCEQIRAEINNQIIDKPIKISISIGLAEYREGLHLMNFIARADNALYQAKDTGKNRTVVSQN